MEALEAGRLTPADNFMLALSTGLGIEPNALGGYLDPTAVAVAFGLACASCARVATSPEKRSAT